MGRFRYFNNKKHDVMDTIIFFWLPFSVVIYIYIAYPALLWVLGRRHKSPHYEPNSLPTISIMISAYNEERYIKRKIENALSIDYPKEAMQVIVVSDGSSDRTLEIAQSFSDERLKIIEVIERKGKPNALNQGLQHATGDILVFTDANVFFDPSSIQSLVKPFSDISCGAVSGCVELMAMESGEPLGEGAYMKYERFMQYYESLLHTMVGIDGGMFAIRHRYITKVPVDVILDDFYMATRVIVNDARIVYQPTAKAHELVPASVSQEFRRKTRIAAGGFQMLKYMGFLKRPLRYFKATFFFVSHKLLRWLSPFFLLSLLAYSLYNSGSLIIDIFFWLQFIFYGLAMLGLLVPVLRDKTIVYVPYYFSAMNIACFIGFWRYLFGTQKVTWNRVER